MSEREECEAAPCGAQSWVGSGENGHYTDAGIFANIPPGVSGLAFIRCEEAVETDNNHVFGPQTLSWESHSLMQEPVHGGTERRFFPRRFFCNY